jgi:hypothetical protein
MEDTYLFVVPQAEADQVGQGMRDRVVSYIAWRSGDVSAPLLYAALVGEDEARDANVLEHVIAVGLEFAQPTDDRPNVDGECAVPAADCDPPILD